MKRIHIPYILMILFLMLTAVSALSEDCEHAWSYTNNGESGHSAACSKCGETRSDSHILTSSFKPATCQAPAETSYACTLCSYSYTFTEGEKNPGHAWGEFVIIRKATCRQAGLQSRTCPDCGQVDSLEIPQLEHDYGQWKPHDERWHIRYCKVCDWAYKGSHRLNDGDITVQPTESQLGIIKYTCRVCGDTFQNILRADGAIYAMDTIDVLSNGTGYLLAASKNEENTFVSEIRTPDGNGIDLRPAKDSEINVYANSKTGNYAGISVETGSANIDVLPKEDHGILSLEFLLLKKSASASLRIFNAAGAIDIANLNGPRVIIAQQKNEDNQIITLLMRVTEKRDSIECEAQIHKSSASSITITNNNGEYDFTLPENAEKLGTLNFKYQRKTGKISVTPRNHENSALNVAIHILEGSEIIRSAGNVKTAETYIQLSDENGAWRLRATYPAGCTLETPLFYKDGAYAGKPIRFIMDETALNELADVDPMSAETQEDAPELVMPEAGKEPESAKAPDTFKTPEPVKAEATPTPAPTLPPVLLSSEEAEILTEETVVLNLSDIKAFFTSEHPAILVQYDANRFIVHQSGDADGWNISSITLTQKGTAFKILNAYALPAQFEISSEGGTIAIRAQLKSGTKTKDISLGTYSFQP